MVAPTGFEPAISTLRGRRPGPLDYEDTTSTNKLSSSTLNIPPEQSHVKLSPSTLSVKRGLPQRLHTRAFGIKFSGKRCCTSDPPIASLVPGAGLEPALTGFKVQRVTSYTTREHSS